MSGTISFLEPTLKVEGPRIAFQLKLNVRPGRHCLFARQSCQLIRSDHETGVAVAGSILAHTTVTHLKVDSFLAGLVLNQPLVRTRVLRIRIAHLWFRVARNHERQNCKDAAESQLSCVKDRGSSGFDGFK